MNNKKNENDVYSQKNTIEWTFYVTEYHIHTCKD